MLASSRASLLERLADNERVLDVGGWAKPLDRADWVIDLLPYETRGLYGGEPDPSAEPRCIRTVRNAGYMYVPL